MSISSHIEAGHGAADLRDRLDVLQAERALAALVGLNSDESYMTSLEDDIAATAAAYVGLAVTEIATLRAQLDGPLVG